MTERHLVIDRLKLSYEGLFNADELYSVIANFFYEKGYDWFEKLNESVITPSGKQIRLVFEPWKNITDYYKLIIRIRVNISDLKELGVEHEGKTLRVNQGAIKVIIDGYVLSDRKGKWNKMPVYWFLSQIMEKYFFREHYQKSEDWVKADIESLHQQIKTYLNTFKYTYGR